MRTGLADVFWCLIKKIHRYQAVWDLIVFYLMPTFKVKFIFESWFFMK
jgi:hypothetical protein